MPLPLDGPMRPSLYAMRPALAGSLLLLALCGCGSSTASDPAKQVFLDGVAQVRHTAGAEKLHAQLRRTIGRLRAANPSGTAGRRGKALALRGFGWTLKGAEARIEIRLNDSGNLEASVHDARRADRYLNRGADLLRRAGAAFGVRIGRLNGH
jgi:hypothetical protein